MRLQVDCGQGRKETVGSMPLTPRTVAAIAARHTQYSSRAAQVSVERETWDLPEDEERPDEVPATARRRRPDATARRGGVLYG